GLGEVCRRALDVHGRGASKAPRRGRNVTIQKLHEPDGGPPPAHPGVPFAGIITRDEHTHVGWDVSSDTAAPREWRRIFQTREVEAIRALLQTTYGKDFAIAPARRGDRHIDLHIDGFDLPNMFIHHLRFGTGIALEGSRSHGHYVICLPLTGGAEGN